MPRDTGWRPLFGQADQSASHRIDIGVEQGDIFLFFGLFRESEGWQRFRTGALKRHVIWGWLQVDEIVHDPVGWAKKNAWARTHPHTYGHWWRGRNILFVGKPQLEFRAAAKAGNLTVPGAGVFERFHERLCLSDPNSKSPTHWRLPAVLKPNPDEGRTISYLESGAWTDSKCGRFVHLNPGHIRKWQEAVICGNPAAVAWAFDLIHDFAA
jgi:hypothetical protein